MNIFVTGATGFLGKFLCAALKKRGDKITAISSKTCDLTDPLSLYAYSLDTGGGLLPEIPGRTMAN
jgi:nucleoside-diphosphate-sugar epimerase